MIQLVIKEERAVYQNRIQLDEIMKKLFYIHNKRPIIDFLNSLYGDNIDYDADITYLNKEAINESIHKKAVFVSQECDMLIKVDSNGRSFEYLLEFQTRNDRRIGIRLFRYSFKLKVQNIRYLASNKPMVIEFPTPYVIVLEENSKIPEQYELILKFHTGESVTYKSKVLKYWKYDLDSLYKNNMYLLFPLKVFQVRKKITAAKRMNEENPKYSLLIKEIRDDILKVSKEILEHIDIIYTENKIDTTEYNEFALVIANLTLYLCQEVERLESIKEEVSSLFKTFIDPEVEKRGIKIGEEKGVEKATIVAAMLLKGESEDNIKKETGLSSEQINKIREILKVQGAHLI